MTSAARMLSYVLAIQVEDVGPSTTMWDTESWTSLAQVALIEQVEREIGRRLSADEAASLVDFHAVSRLIESGAVPVAGGGKDGVVDALRTALDQIPGDGPILAHTSFASVGSTGTTAVDIARAFTGWSDDTGRCVVLPAMTGRIGSRSNVQDSVTYDMGLIAEVFWRLPGVVRTDHPTSSMAGYGPEVERLLFPHPLDCPEGPSGPIGRLYERDGWVALFGVDHSNNTSIHLAEYVCNVPYIRSVPIDRLAPTGPTMRAITHCAQRFVLVGDRLANIGAVSSAMAGEARLDLIAMRDVVACAIQLIRADANVFLCPSGTCAECDATRRY